MGKAQLPTAGLNCDFGAQHLGSLVLQPQIRGCGLLLHFSMEQGLLDHMGVTSHGEQEQSEFEALG